MAGRSSSAAGSAAYQRIDPALPVSARRPSARPPRSPGHFLGHGLGPPVGELGRRYVGGGGDGAAISHQDEPARGTGASPPPANSAGAWVSGGSKGRSPSPAPAGDPRSVAPKGMLALDPQGVMSQPWIGPRIGPQRLAPQRLGPASGSRRSVARYAAQSSIRTRLRSNRSERA